MKNLEGKVVVVTGGSGLLGRGFCAKIAEEGGTAVVADKNFATAKEFALSLEHRGLKAIAVEIDITDKASLERAVAEIEKKCGKIDALVNNAYPRTGNYNKDFFDVDYGALCENLNLHLAGYFLASQVFAKYFVAQKSGSIVNIGSIYGVIPPRFELYAGTSMKSGPEYAMIKAGVLHLTTYMAQRLKGTGVRVNSVCPGGIFDHQPDSFIQAYRARCADKGMLDPADIVGALVFLLSDAAKYVQAQNIIVDDGFTLG